jgi:hypothetical protein
MSGKRPDVRDFDRFVYKGLLDLVLDETREVGNKAVLHLRQLSTDLPSGVVEQIEQMHQDPAHERRTVARLQGTSTPATVQGLEGQPTAVKDRSPMGIALHLPSPVNVGSILRVRVHPERDGEWILVEVKHCSREGDEWVAGCELLPGQPAL